MTRLTLTKVFCWAWTVLMVCALLSIPFFNVVGMGVFAGALTAAAVCWCVAWGLATGGIKWGRE